MGLVTIRLIRGNGDNGRFGKLVIWMPEKYLSYEQLELESKILDSYCQKVANWFMRSFGCQLGLPELYQKPHFAFQDDPCFLDVAKKCNLSSEQVWVDRSKGRSEWETCDVKLAKVRLELPERVLSLEVRMDRVEDGISCINDKIDSLLDLFSVPVRPDERRDVV